jgi:putative tryptophan/tyrosine transport system substrate-binding protein
VRRREFIKLVGGAGVAWPLPARAQQAQGSNEHARVAFLGAESPSISQHFLDAFRQGLREYGYIDGQNITLEARWADGRSERFPELVDDLIRLKARVIVTVSVAAALAPDDHDSNCIHRKRSLGIRARAQPGPAGREFNGVFALSRRPV